MIDYGVDYATILPNGELLLDLSPIRVTGPMIPVIRVCRAWVEVLGIVVESTPDKKDLAQITAKLQTAGLAVDHVLSIDMAPVTLGADKVFRATGSCYVGGDRTYPLNVSISALGQALASVSQ